MKRAQPTPPAAPFSLWEATPTSARPRPAAQRATTAWTPRSRPRSHKARNVLLRPLAAPPVLDPGSPTGGWRRFEPRDTETSTPRARSAASERRWRGAPRHSCRDPPGTPRCAPAAFACMKRSSHGPFMSPQRKAPVEAGCGPIRCASVDGADDNFARGAVDFAVQPVALNP